MAYSTGGTDLECGPLVAAAESEHRLTILHTNDLLGRLLPEPYFDEADRGGFARLAYLIAEQQSGRSDSILVLDGGDALGDSPLAGVDAGRMVVQLMNAMGYDAMVVGNHEFDYGLDSLRVRASEANFNMLSANVRVASDSTALFAPFVLVERAGLQIALIGLLSPQALKVINPVKNPALNIDDPHLVLKTLLEGPAGRADLQVVLVHMSRSGGARSGAGFPTSGPVHRRRLWPGNPQGCRRTCGALCRGRVFGHHAGLGSFLGTGRHDRAPRGGQGRLGGCAASASAYKPRGSQDQTCGVPY